MIWYGHEIFVNPLKCYYDQNFMSRMKQKYVLYSLSDVAVPVLVTEMKFGPRKLKILSLENWCFRVRHYEFMFQRARGMKVIGVAVFLFKPIVFLS